MVVPSLTSMRRVSTLVLICAALLQAQPGIEERLAAVEASAKRVKVNFSKEIVSGDFSHHLCSLGDAGSEVQVNDGWHRAVVDIDGGRRFMSGINDYIF